MSCLELDRIKCVVIGDKDTGKTTLIRTFTTVTIPGTEELHNDFIYFNTQIKIRRTLRSLEIYDIVTHCPQSSLIPVLYSSANLFLVCFSVIDRESFERAQNIWLPMARNQNAHAPVVLIGTKTDLYTNNSNCISRWEATSAAYNLGLVGYFENSSLNHKQIKRNFNKIMQCVVCNKNKQLLQCVIQ